MNARVNIHPPVANDPSLLELYFPHIVEGLLKVWNSPEATERYLDSLLVDDRDNRQGLPASVFMELMFLADLNWKRAHYITEEVQITADNFSFGAP